MPGPPAVASRCREPGATRLRNRKATPWRPRRNDRPGGHGSCAGRAARCNNCLVVPSLLVRARPAVRACSIPFGLSAKRRFRMPTLPSSRSLQCSSSPSLGPIRSTITPARSSKAQRPGHRAGGRPGRQAGQGAGVRAGERGARRPRHRRHGVPTRFRDETVHGGGGDAAGRGGEASLDDPVSKHVDDLPEVWRPVTVRQLLNHTSRIKGYTSAEAYRRAATTTRPRRMCRAGRRRAAGVQAWRAARLQQHGLLPARPRHRTCQRAKYGEYVKAKIFEPLGMRSSRLNRLDDVIPHRADGYSFRDAP